MEICSQNYRNSFCWYQFVYKSTAHNYNKMKLTKKYITQKYYDIYRNLITVLIPIRLMNEKHNSIMNCDNHCRKYFMNIY